MARKRIMDQQNSPGIKNEMKLLHGWPRYVIDKISHQGFNRSFAGKMVVTKCTYFLESLLCWHNGRDQNKAFMSVYLFYSHFRIAIVS